MSKPQHRPQWSETEQGRHLRFLKAWFSVVENSDLRQLTKTRGKCLQYYLAECGQGLSQCTVVLSPTITMATNPVTTTTTSTTLFIWALITIEMERSKRVAQP